LTWIKPAGQRAAYDADGRDAGVGKRCRACLRPTLAMRAKKTQQDACTLPRFCPAKEKGTHHAAKSDRRLPCRDFLSFRQWPLHDFYSPASLANIRRY
jgi:hypothetical protein